MLSQSRQFLFFVLGLAIRTVWFVNLHTLQISTNSEWWQDELHEYLGLMQALHTAFADRHNALITVQTLATDVVTINKQIEKSVAASNKVFGGSKSQNRKTEELKESLKNTEEASQLAHKQYDQIKVCITSSIREICMQRVNLLFLCWCIEPHFIICRIAIKQSWSGSRKKEIVTS